MDLELDNLTKGHRFEEFLYRLVYFHPSPYSDERVAVGIVADGYPSIESTFVSTRSAIDLLAHLFGDTGVEQFQFAVAELRRALSHAPGIADIDIPTNILTVGEPVPAYTKDRAGFLSSVLAASSTLLRAGTTRVVEQLNSADTVAFSQEVMDEVSRLNPFLGNRIFHHRIKIRDGEIVDLPILGSRIFGAPISFATRDYRLRAEAYVAKFNWVRNHISQEPRIYIRAPSPTALDNTERLDRSIRELHQIAQASHVPIKMSYSTEELASAIVYEEAV